jgi:hypothetical protein
MGTVQVEVAHLTAEQLMLLQPGCWRVRERPQALTAAQMRHRLGGRFAGSPSRRDR